MLEVPQVSSSTKTIVQKQEPKQVEILLPKESVASKIELNTGNIQVPVKQTQMNTQQNVENLSKKEQAILHLNEDIKFAEEGKMAMLPNDRKAFGAILKRIKLSILKNGNFDNVYNVLQNKVNTTPDLPAIDKKKFDYIKEFKRMYF